MAPTSLESSNAKSQISKPNVVNNRVDRKLCFDPDCHPSVKMLNSDLDGRTKYNLIGQEESCHGKLAR